MDQLEANGVVGPADGNKRRKILQPLHKGSDAESGGFNDEDDL